MQVKLNAQKLKAIRKEKKISQESLAEQAGLSDRYIRALEGGYSDNPSASLVCRVSKALGVSMDDLMEVFGEDEDTGATL